MAKEPVVAAGAGSAGRSVGAGNPGATLYRGQEMESVMAAAIEKQMARGVSDPEKHLEAKLKARADLKARWAKEDRAAAKAAKG